MGYHNNEETTRKALKDAQRFINDRERYKQALCMTLGALGIPPEQTIAEIRKADFRSLKDHLSSVNGISYNGA